MPRFKTSQNKLASKQNGLKKDYHRSALGPMFPNKLMLVSTSRHEVSGLQEDFENCHFDDTLGSTIQTSDPMFCKSLVSKVSEPVFAKNSRRKQSVVEGDDWLGECQRGKIQARPTQIIDLTLSREEDGAENNPIDNSMRKESVVESKKLHFEHKTQISYKAQVPQKPNILQPPNFWEE